MNKPTLAFLGAAALLALASPTFAGQKGTVEVTINHKYRYASGSLAGARNSADGMQKIGCGLFSSESYGTYLSCSAVDAEGNGAWCTSTSDAIINSAHAINGDSQLTFWWTDIGTCERLEVFNDSSAAPKQP